MVIRLLKNVLSRRSRLSVETSRLSGFCLAFFLTYVSAASADDTEIYFTGLVEENPNVLLVLDRSGSMGNAREGSDLTKLQELQTSLMAFIDEAAQAANLNIGIMTYSRDVLLEQQVVALDTSNADAIDEVVDGVTANGRTETLLALEAARKYFSGELVVNVDTGEIPDALAAGIDPATIVDTTTLESPITDECQANHIVLVTDGSPSANLDLVEELELGVLSETLAQRETLPPDTLEGACLQQNVAGQSAANSVGNGNCGAELARYMYQNDLLPGTLAGDNVVRTHTIGFNFQDPWLATLSDEMTGGGGTHHEVESINQLQEALANVFNSVSSASFAAPTVSNDSFNQSRHRDELYFAPFKPSNRERWTGNIKKYRLAVDLVVDDNGDAILDADGNVEFDPQIVDVNGNSIVDDLNNTLATSQSFWAGAPDGAAVADGGFAGNLTPYEDRFWYTDPDALTNPTANLEPIRITEDDIGDISPAILGAGSDPERDTLMSWALAPDVPFEDNTTRSYVADSLHGSPQLLTYNSSTSIDPNVRTEVLFAATNQGVLHAIDPLTGEELWSYSPVEHLPNIRDYFRNRQTRGERTYGLDGEILLHSTRVESPAYDFEVDKARLYMTERRGGNRVYGLDIFNGHASETLDGSAPFEVLWKITGGADGTDEFEDLAQSWSKPVMISVRFGCPRDCEEKELLMFSGGYNASEYDDVNLDFATFEGNAPESGHGNAVYLVDPDTGERVWSVGNGSAGDNANHDLNLPMEHSIPSTPVPIDTNLDGFVDLLFFVDISGDVWRVDLSRGDSDPDAIHLGGGQIAALSPEGQSLRFFNQLDVSISGFNATTSNYFLVTGSGMRNSPLFPEPNNNRLYAIADRNIQRVPTDYRYVIGEDGNDNSIITASDDIIRNVDDPNSTTSVFHGFYRSFPLDEKVLVPTQTSSFRVRASTYVPPALSTEGCAGPIGNSRLYLLALPNGENAIPEDVTEGYFAGGEGIQGPGVQINTGDGDSTYLLFDKEVRATKDVIVGAAEVYRKFQRTGWVEQDGY